MTTQRLLTQKERTFGNSLLQSGASIGAIVTPLITQVLVTDQAGSWRAPFAVIGVIGAAWIIPWFALIGRNDLASPVAPADGASALANRETIDSTARELFWRRYGALACVVIMINLTWHYFRVWMPGYLREFLDYDRKTVNFFTSVFYVMTDVGCITVGIATSWLAARGWPLHSARMVLFFGCSCLTALTAAAAWLPHGPIVLAAFLAIGFGSLGLFPIYYSLSQELSTRNQGKITGSLSAITWVVTALTQEATGRVVDATGSHAAIMTTVGLLPLVACAALWFLWGDRRVDSAGSTG